MYFFDNYVLNVELANIDNRIVKRNCNNNCIYQVVHKKLMHHRLHQIFSVIIFYKFFS